MLRRRRYLLNTFILSRSGGFSPRSLFAAGEVGAWYDPSDLTTLYQDAAGTTPVTTPGQVVGRINDKSGRGNHATQTGATSVRPIYAVEPATGRRNLLTYTADFADAYWLKQRASLSGSFSFSLGTMQGLVEDATTNSHRVVINGVSVTPSITHTFSCYLKSNTRTAAYISVQSGSAGEFVTVIVDLSTGQISQTTNGSTLGTIAASGVTSIGDGVYRAFVSYTMGAKALIYPVIGLSNATTATLGQSVDVIYAGDGTSGIYIWGAQLETGSTATAYQRVVSQYDVSESGVASRHYLAFDGIDDWLQTGTITPGVDKAQIFAGVRKLSDAARGMIAEFSATTANNGTFGLEGPGFGAGNTYGFTSRGTTNGTVTPTGFTAPITNVLTGLGDISGDSTILRVNGAQVAQSVVDQGTGNFLAYPLYIGRRGGTTLPFSGHLYGLVIRFGANLSTAQISNAERWLARKTGAF